MPESKPTRFHEYDAQFASEGGSYEWYGVGLMIDKICDRQRESPTAEDEEPTSDDYKDHLSAVADECERTLVQCDAIPVENLSDHNVRSIISRELRDAASILRYEATDPDNTTEDEYISALEDTFAYLDEAKIMLNLVKIANGAHVPHFGDYLSEGGQFGFTRKTRFKVDNLITPLESSYTTLKNSRIDESRFNQSSRKKVIDAGVGIKNVLEVLMKSLDTTHNDPIEQTFRLISAKLEAMLSIIMGSLHIPIKYFQSHIFARTRSLEIQGGFAPVRINHPKLGRDITLTSELEDAILLMTYALYISEIRAKK